MKITVSLPRSTSSIVSIMKRLSRCITRRICTLRIKDIHIFRSFIKICGTGPNLKQRQMNSKNIFLAFPVNTEICILEVQ